MSSSCVILWGAVWLLAGLAVLVIAEIPFDRDPPRRLTVGDLLLFMAVGAPFLPLVLGTLLCQVRLPPLAVRKRKQPEPDGDAAAVAEVEGWLRP